MKTIFYLLVLSILVIGACQTPEAGSTKKPKAIFIILDGIPADVVEKVATPYLDTISRIAGYSRAYVGGIKGSYSETPTISAPGYMDLLTSTWANKHNVWDNYNQQPNYHYWNIFRMVEQHDSSLQTAIFSTWQDNRTILVGEGQPRAGNFQIDYAFDGFERDTLQFPHDKEARYIQAIDEHVSTEAARYIHEKGPDLSWVYLEYTDDVGHASGDGEAFYAAVRQADAQVGKIWQAIKYRESLREDWLIVITTDHGRDALTGRGHGGQSTRERTTWMVTNAANLNSHYTSEEPYVVDIAPTLLKHLGIVPPTEIRQEMDGTPFIGPISMSNFAAEIQGDMLHARWTPHAESGQGSLRIAFTNTFAKGGQDDYYTLGKVPVLDGQAKVKLSQKQLETYQRTRFAKIVLQGPYNTSNYWIVNAVIQ